jgi:hypothetical protein
MDLSREIAQTGYFYDSSRISAYTAGLLSWPVIHAIAEDGMPICPFRPKPPEYEFCWSSTRPYWAYVDCPECLAIGDEQHKQAEREHHSRQQAQRMLDKILGR